MLEADASKAIANLSTLQKQLGLEKGGLVQRELDRLVIDYCLPYCPWDTGTLAASAYNASVAPGEILYPGPYAHYLYYGEVYGPNIPIFEDDSGEPTRWVSPRGKKKYATGRRLKYNKDINAQAGAYWFERMKADRLTDLIEDVQKYAELLAKQR